MALQQKRQVYHVVYSKDHWRLKKKEGRTYNFDTKKEAIERGRDLAKSHKLGQLVIHRKDNRIQTEYTYGKDPRKSRG